MRKKILSVVVATAATICLLAGCGKESATTGNDSAATETSSGETTESSSAAADESWPNTLTN